jgi:hypothetical protein
MTCHELAERLAAIDPELPPTEIARLALVILADHEDPSVLADDAELTKAWSQASFRLDAAADQHAAMADELEAVCGDGPVRFTPDQLWALLRALKVQSQILEIYTGKPLLV